MSGKITTMKPEGEGPRTVVWDGRNAQGQYLPPGNYVAFAYSYHWDDFERFSIALPPVVATPTPQPTATPSDQSEPCEDLQALFPSQLANPINAAQNMLQPISAPAPMNQDLGNWQKLLKKGKDRQAKIAAEQAKAKPNQNKITLWQGEIVQTQVAAAQLQTQMSNRVSQMNSARPALHNALNSVAQAPDFSQDGHADVQFNPLPQTLAEYREAIASLVK